MGKGVSGISGYIKDRDFRKSFHRALARTDLAVRLVQKKITGRRKVLEPDFRVWSWILANHILQCWHASTGLDVRPFSIGGMYGYGSAVGWFSGERHHESHELSWIANGSVRVDPQQGDLPSYDLIEAIKGGTNPFLAVQTAAERAILGQDPLKPAGFKVPGRVQAEIYLTVCQTLTLLLAGGWAEEAILGEYVDCSEYGGSHEIARHPLRKLGLVERACFTYEFLVARFHNEAACAGTEAQNRFWIRRNDGKLVLGNSLKVIAYEDWCGGSVERGMKTLLESAGS